MLILAEGRLSTRCSLSRTSEADIRRMESRHCRADCASFIWGNDRDPLCDHWTTWFVRSRIDFVRASGLTGYRIAATLNGVWRRQPPAANDAW